MGKNTLDKVVSVSTSLDGFYYDLPAVDASISIEGDMLDDSDLTTLGQRSRKVGLKDWNAEGTIHMSTRKEMQIMLDSIFNKTDFYLRYWPLGSSLSSLGYKGSMKVESLEFYGTIEDKERVDFSFSASSAIKDATKIDTFYWVSNNMILETSF